MDDFVRVSLEASGCDKFLPLFIENEIDQEAFLGLSEARLEKLLPGKVGPQIRILTQIEAEREKRSGTTPMEKHGKASSSVDLRRLNACTLNLDEILIHKDRPIGCGNFGCVYLGEFKNSSRKVAVKLLKIEDDTNNKQFNDEVKVLTNIGSHKNLIQLIGVCVQEQPSRQCVIVTEFCTHGDLHRYISSKRDGFVPDLNRRPSIHKLGDMFSSIGRRHTTASTIIHPHTLTSSQLLNWSLQISEGMEYLSAKQVPLPWAWTAPECLKKLEFSVGSDIWSFGVTLWEIFSLCEVPYAGFKWTTEFVSQIESGMRLRKPKHAPRRIFSIMKRCWEIDPNQRVKFSVVRNELDAMLQASEAKVNSHNSLPSGVTLNLRDSWLEGSNESLVESLEQSFKEAHLLTLSSDTVKIEIDYDDCLKERRNWCSIMKAYNGQLEKPTQARVYVEIVSAFKDVGSFSADSITRRYINKLKIYTEFKSRTGANLGHRNILQLMCAEISQLKYGSLTIVSEFCEQGRMFEEIERMKSNITACNSTAKDEPSDDTNFPNSSNQILNLHRWALEVADGMRFLSNKGVVLCYLTTKGVGFSNNFAPKIFITPNAHRIPFGHISGSITFRPVCFPVPWKYMAVESQRDGRVSLMSDVWTYGTFLWTIFALGTEPYLGVGTSKEGLCEHVAHFMSNLMPIMANNNIHDVIKRCLLVNPSERTNFDQILIDLRVIGDLLGVVLKDERLEETTASP